MKIIITKSIFMLLLLVNISFFGCKSGLQKGGSDGISSNTVTVSFYNVENLFDIKDNPQTNDNDFTPEGKLQWDQTRYSQKIEKLAKVISSIDSVNNTFPVIIGLCEVENRAVLEDLVRSPQIKAANYEIIHRDSPDPRGIDNALLYQSRFFELDHYETIHVSLPDTSSPRTRDILYVKGFAAGDTLHIYVNHWSSRSGGEKESEHKRLLAARILRSEVDKILINNNNAKVIIIGDMNDEPTNKSIQQVLLATNNATSGNSLELYNMMANLKKEGKGSYNYRGQWNMLDNIIVSHGLLNSQKGLGCKPGDADIFSAEWMMFEHPKNGKTPNRTYGGENYYGGFSDHLPVYLKLRVD